ncbi:MAG TPA: S-layer homology domain-containing protein [Paenibacillaceae bacterium]
MKRGIVQGKSPTVFAPDDPVSREEAAVILIRTLTAITGRTPPVADEAFRDENRISAWALEAVQQARAAGLLRGRGDGTFDPGAVMTRAEGAQLIKNLLDARPIKQRISPTLLPIFQTCIRIKV